MSGDGSRPSRVPLTAALVALAIVLVWMTSNRLYRPVVRDAAPTSDAHDRLPAWPDMRLDVNAAPAAELAALPGIGPVLAGRIVDHRRRHGPFPDIDALRGVKGIGERTLERLRPYIIAEGAARPVGTVSTPQPP